MKTITKKSVETPTTVTLTDKQKLQLFCEDLRKQTGPELKEQKSRELLNGTLEALAEFCNFFSEEIESI